VGSWSRGLVVSWSRGLVVSWSRGLVVSWSRGLVVSWSRGLVVSWSRGSRGSRGLVVSWSRLGVLGCLGVSWGVLGCLGSDAGVDGRRCGHGLPGGGRLPPTAALRTTGSTATRLCLRHAVAVLRPAGLAPLPGEIFDLPEPLRRGGRFGPAALICPPFEPPGDHSVLNGSGSGWHTLGGLGTLVAGLAWATGRPPPRPCGPRALPRPAYAYGMPSQCSGRRALLPPSNPPGTRSVLGGSGSGWHTLGGLGTLVAGLAWGAATAFLRCRAPVGLGARGTRCSGQRGLERFRGSVAVGAALEVVNSGSAPRGGGGLRGSGGWGWGLRMFAVRGFSGRGGRRWVVRWGRRGAWGGIYGLPDAAPRTP
jgi:hypothetical protein